MGLMQRVARLRLRQQKLVNLERTRGVYCRSGRRPVNDWERLD